jgi:hypothetical protein
VFVLADGPVDEVVVVLDRFHVGVCLVASQTHLFVLVAPDNGLDLGVEFAGGELAIGFELAELGDEAGDEGPECFVVFFHGVDGAEGIVGEVYCCVAPFVVSAKGETDEGTATAGSDDIDECHVDWKRGPGRKYPNLLVEGVFSFILEILKNLFHASCQINLDGINCSYHVSFPKELTVVEVVVRTSSRRFRLPKPCIVTQKSLIRHLLERNPLFWLGFNFSHHGMRKHDPRLWFHG